MSPDNKVQIASLIDLTATKLKTIQQRAETKDYCDIAAALDSGISLSRSLAAARAIYGKNFNAMVALKSANIFCGEISQAYLWRYNNDCEKLLRAQNSTKFQS